VWSQKSATLLGITAPLMAFAVPLADVLLVMARRFLRQKPLFNADRLHIHHRLLERGLTPRRVVLVLYGVAGIGAFLALLSTILNDRYAGFALLLFCGLACVGVKSLGYLEFRTAGRIAFRGTFREVLRSEMILHTTSAHLKHADTPADCWRVLKTVASELGFCRVRMKLDEVEFQESFDDLHSEPLWTIHIPLNGRGRVELAHRFQQDAAALSVAPLTDLLHRSLGLAGSGQRAEPRDVPVPQPSTAMPTQLAHNFSLRPIRKEIL
jgi:hypothetical protein